MKLDVERKGQLTHAEVTPQKSCSESGETTYQVGVAVLDPTSYRRVSFTDGVRDAFVMTGERTKETIGRMSDQARLRPLGTSFRRIPRRPSAVSLRRVSI